MDEGRIGPVILTGSQQFLMGSRRIPVEIKAGQTIAPDAFRQLDAYSRLAGSEGGVLVYAGDEHTQRGPHRIRPWWACT